MKRLLKSILILCLILLTSIMTLTGCDVLLNQNDGNGGDDSSTPEHTCEYGPWQVIEPPTCSSYGVERRSCGVCEAYESRSIEIKGEHTFEEWETSLDIDYEEFCMIMNKKDRNLTKRLFNAIDVNSDGSLNYREFIKFISVFINGSIEEQISLSYKIFMNPQTKVIDYDTMKQLLYDVVQTEETLKEFFTTETVEELVSETFIEINGDTSTPINITKYKEMVMKLPQILTWLQVDLNIILKNKSVNRHKKIGCFN